MNFTRLSSVTILGTLVALTSARCGAQSTIAPPDDIRASLATYVAAYPHAVVMIGVVDGDSANFYTLTGSDVAAKNINEHSIFQVGSITKTFTATLLAQMVQAHEVALDDPIQKYLPRGVKAPTFAGKPITLLNLAEQNSGLPRLPDNLTYNNTANPYADYTPARMYAFLSRYHLNRAPGAQYEYSNLGVTLLGQLLANRAHATYAELVTQRILRPLGMSDTTVTGTAASRTNLVPGYAADETPAIPWDFGQLGAAGAIESSLHDMLIYLKANLTAPQGPLGPAMALAQRPRVPIGLNGIMQIGLVWQTNVRSGITWHNGETGGYHAFLGFNTAKDQGVVLLGNRGDMDLDALAVHILAPYIPVPAPVAVSQKEPSPYSGVYRFSPAFAITVFKARGTLYAQGTGQSALALTPASGQTFLVQGVDAKITFDLDANGNATALILHQNGRDQRAAKAL